MNQKEYSLELANTIINQMKASIIPGNSNSREITGVQGMMCWGYKKPAVIKDGLQFGVNSRFLENGAVKVILDRGADLYDIEFYDKSNRKKGSMTGIYAEDLAATIDYSIESGKGFMQ